jgi:hypothetical protein
LDYNLPSIIQDDPTKGTIRISPTTSLDEGIYQCVAGNTFGKDVSDVTQLRRAVLSMTTAHQVVEYTGMEGSGFKLNCDPVKSVPPPVYSWVMVDNLFDDDPTTIRTDDRIQIDEEGNLYFAYLEQSDNQNGKIYKCVAFNPVLDISTRTSLAVINVDASQSSNVPPVAVYHSPSPVVAFVGETVTLRCIFEGHPVPLVFWERTDEQFPPEDRHTMDTSGSLTLKDIQLEDEGVYICSAINDAGSTSADVRLDVQGSAV